ncbi:hypothetical protein PIB30_033166, partial [Stylosanthes scabra]|nr:hypothetical protein [Stylosanthes scabra]
MSRHKHDKCDLPLELIGEILARLPVRLLLLLKTVCRSWNSLISSHDFAMQRLQRPSQPRLAYSCSTRDTWGWGAKNCISHCSLPSLLLHDQLHPAKLVPLSNGMDKQLFIEGSCNRLLCLSKGTPNLNLTLFNPCTGSISRTATTENPSNLGRCIFYGFGWSKVFTFDANPSWKEVDRPMFPYYTIQNNHGKFFRDTLNWLMFDPTKDVADGLRMKHREWFILTFELESESFGRLCLPTARKNNAGGVDLPILGVLKNRLCVSFHPHLYTLTRFTELWIMEEYGIEKSWTMLFKIQHDDGGNGMPEIMMPLYISEDDDLLL